MATCSPKSLLFLQLHINAFAPQFPPQEPHKAFTNNPGLESLLRKSRFFLPHLLHHFRSHPARCAHERFRHVSAISVPHQPTRNAEVGELHATVLSQEDIAGFDVSMDLSRPFRNNRYFFRSDATFLVGGGNSSAPGRRIRLPTFVDADLSLGRSFSPWFENNARRLYRCDCNVRTQLSVSLIDSTIVLHSTPGNTVVIVCTRTLAGRAY